MQSNFHFLFLLNSEHNKLLRLRKGKKNENELISFWSVSKRCKRTICFECVFDKAKFGERL